jgi:DNA-binding transcriptional ArsR family regulator
VTTVARAVEAASWEVGRLAGIAAAATPVVVAALLRRNAIRATDAAASAATELLLGVPTASAQQAAEHIAALRVIDEGSNTHAGSVQSALDRSALSQALGDAALARLNAVFDEFDAAGSTLEFAARVAGSVIAPAPASPTAQRAASLAAALILARAGLSPAPWLAPTRLDAAARSAAVAAERSGLWDEWTIAWCAMLNAEAADISHALHATHLRMEAERKAARGQPRVGATDDEVLAWLHSYSTFTIKEAGSALGLTPPTVGSAIARLEGAGYATELTGQKRDRVWTSSALLELVVGH